MEASNMPMPTIPSPSVPIEQFNLFHSIDRRLYTRLIRNLGRDPSESIHVMGFLLWLEQDAAKDLTIIDRMLSLSLPLIKEIADEIVFCLRLIENDTIRPQDAARDLPLLQSLVGKNISLQHFHDNRLAVLRGVSRTIGEVCVRAFCDILQNVAQQKAALQVPVRANETVETIGQSHQGTAAVAAAPLATMPGGGQVDSIPRRAFVTGNNEMRPFYPTQAIFVPVGYQGAAVNVPLQIFPGGNMQGYTERQGRFTRDELSEMFRNNLRFVGDEEELSPDKRTIFLTFSKGYPVSENEVWEYFTRRFGDFIEAIHMQEVEGDGQVLYARVVAKSAAMMDRVVEGGRAKYYINGKHVCARRYIRKQRSPPGRDAAAAQ